MPHDALKLLFVDDEDGLRTTFCRELRRAGYEVVDCPDGASALKSLDEATFDCMIVDLNMPGMSGLELIAKAKDIAPETGVVILTGNGSMQTAITALRHGVFDYLTKPCKLVELKAVLERFAEQRKLTQRYRAAKQRLRKLEGTTELVGRSAAMETVRRLIARVAPTDSTVLILGETGTGKELVARSIHEQSPRAEMPLVTINCGALPEHLIESELFGHRKGAFTGAEEHRPGLFEVAHGGTLFLDEIGELPKPMQAKLLRVLESGEVRRIGDTKAFTCDVRIVAATHRDLPTMVADGEFREDLWYRINTFELRLPPLRERREDIPLLADYLARRLRPRIESQALFTDAALEQLCRHDWPGNVRELANVIEYAWILCDRPPIDVEHLPGRFASEAERRPVVASQTTFAPSHAIAQGLSLREIERHAIYAALDRHDGNKPEAAKELGISLKTLYNKLNQYEAERAAG